MTNVKLSYLYRDGANYKQFGSAVFANSAGTSLEVIEAAIVGALIEGTWFYADKWGLKDLHSFPWDNEIDHTWHEYEAVEETTEEAGCGDIRALLERILLPR